MSIDRRSLVQTTSRRGFIAAGALATYSLIPVKFSLGANPCANGNPLEPILEAASKAFNDASLSGTKTDWDKYGAFLDDNVTLVRMRGGPPISPKTGGNGVMAYLYSIADHDQFSLKTQCSFKTATSTRAVGKAYWQDDTNGCSLATPGACPQINYLFDFTSIDPTIAKIIWMVGTNEHP
jgi:hypothetical protein